MEKLRNFMQDRHGFDKLGMFLIIASVVFSLISRLFWFRPFYWVSIAFDILFIFRFLSTKTFARQRENRIFLDLFEKAKEFIQRDRVNNQYYKCPICKTKFNVERNAQTNKYTTKVMCPKCKNEF